ncbi:MAG: rubrerythrin family protein, partial [Kiritimatiellia bacterium]
MKMVKRGQLIRLVAGVACALGMNLQAGEAALKVGTTLENLQAAYNGESNAKSRYEAFAKQADKDGYLKVATLFKAAAFSESIHLKKHAAAISKLGGKAKADIQAPVVKSTQENLATALSGETYEAAVMYPAFVAQAEKDGNDKAKMSF